DDFYNFVKFPARYIGNANEKNEKQERKATFVTFLYNETAEYSLKFIDEGMSTWNTDDSNSYGKVEFISNGTTVLGLDISKDESKLDAARWRWSNVFAFFPGPWMKDLVEIAAY